MSFLTRLKVRRKVLLNDLLASLVMATGTVPGSLANGVLAGTNPVYGVYSTIAGTTMAALFTSSVIMNVDTTSATAIATGDVLSGTPPEQQWETLAVLGMLVGLFMLIFGFLKLGFLVRFISNAVMVGFLSGLGVITILGQWGDLTGYYSDAPNKVFQTVDTLLHFREIDPATFLIGILTITLIVIFSRTRLDRYAFLIAMVITTVLVLLPAFSSVGIVGDVTEIPQGLPTIALPNLTLIPGLVLPALAVAIIALVQASGVSQSIPNPDGEYPDPSGDFRGQGAGNVAVGFLGGLPVGGSLSGTIYLKSVGGVSRWANIFTGIFALLSLLIFAPLIELLPMPTLAAMLVVVGVSMVNVPRIETVWHTGAVPLAIMAITFVFTLFTSVQLAVAVGVAFHVILYVYRSAEAVQIKRVIPQPDGTFIDGEAPDVLPSAEIVALLPVGSLFFAGAAEFEEHLPEVGDAQRTVVIIGLRDRDEIGSTFVRIIERYAEQLDSTGNKLMLAGMNERIIEQLDKTELMGLLGKEDIFPAEPQYFGPLNKAMAKAQLWIAAGNADVEA